MRVFVDELQQHRDRRVLNVLIVRRRLEVRQHRAELGRDRHHLDALIDQAFVPQLFDDPPDRLHVPDVHRLVVVVEIDPAAETRDRVTPLRDVTLHDFAALGVVAGDAELRDDLGRRDTELFVDLVFDRQTVAVPAEATQHIASLHRPVARHHVFQRRRHQMPVVRQTGRERRAVVEDVRLLVARVLERFAEQITVTPEIQNRVFHCHEIERAGWCFSRFRHGRAIVRWLSEGAFYAPLPSFHAALAREEGDFTPQRAG